MNFAFHPDALAEFVHAARYYAEKQVELAQHFFLSAEHAIRKLCEKPSHYALRPEKGTPFSRRSQLAGDALVVDSVLKKIQTKRIARERAPQW